MLLCIDLVSSIVGRCSFRPWMPLKEISTSIFSCYMNSLTVIAFVGHFCRHLCGCTTTSSGRHWPYGIIHIQLIYTPSRLTHNPMSFCMHLLAKLYTWLIMFPWHLIVWDIKLFCHRPKVILWSNLTFVKWRLDCCHYEWAIRRSRSCGWGWLSFRLVGVWRSDLPGYSRPMKVDHK